MTIPAYVINRKVDTHRLEHFRATAPGELASAEVVEAVDASAPGFSPEDNPEYRGSWFGQPGIKPGAFACFLSHMKAWRNMLTEGHAFALFFEDDALVKPNLLGLAAERPSDADVCFFNFRASTWVKTPVAGSEFAPSDISISRAIRNQLKIGQDVITPGGEAYGLSNAAARVLLYRTDIFGITCGVDWILFTSGLCKGDFTESETAGYHVFSHIYPQFPRIRLLKTYLTTTPAAHEVSKKLGGSVLDHARILSAP